VPIRFDGAGVLGAASHLAGQADGARSLTWAAGTLAEGVVEPQLTAAVALLGDVCADVLEVLGLDLDLLSSLVLAGAAVYTQVEDGALQVPG
jgi:hypothetical protein